MVVTVSVGDIRPRLRCLLRDITGQRKTEDALRLERDFSSRLLESAPVIVLVLDGDGHIVRSNAYTHQLTGYAESELDRSGWDVLLADGAAAGAAYLQSLAASQREPQVLAVSTRDGLRRDVAWSGQALSLESGGPGYLLLGQNITELHQAQQRAFQAE